MIEIFTKHQMKSLNEFQQCGFFHPFTCSDCGNDLTATKNGWICSTDGCEYTQGWCHSFMADWSWKKQVEHMFPAKKEK